MFRQATESALSDPGSPVSALPPGRLERVCRYALRPPRAQERLHRTSEGEIWLTLRRRWADGTTHLRFDRWSCSSGWPC